MFLLSLSFRLLTVSQSEWLTDPLLRSEGLTDPLLQSEGLTDPLLRSGNALQVLEHVLGQLVPMSCHFRDNPSI